MATHVEELTPSKEVQSASWVMQELAPFQDLTVAAFIPARFESYARVLHPAGLRVGDVVQSVRWADIGRAAGESVNHAADWNTIVIPAMSGPGWDHEPAIGTLPPATAEALVETLRRQTATPDKCWFGVWDGLGGLPRRHTSGVLNFPSRPMRLLTGSVECAGQPLSDPPMQQSPSVWWPQDRAWFVATDVDLMSTFVGGTADCIAAVLANPNLEVWQVAADQRVDIDGP